MGKVERPGSATGRFLRVDDGWNRRDHCTFPPIRIPWSMIAPHDEQAKQNHAGQDLARLESRGGVSSDEALAILDDRNWTPMDTNAAHDELIRRVQEYSENVKRPHDDRQSES